MIGAALLFAQTPSSDAAYARLVDQGWTDAIRQMHSDERVYTFWHYMRNRWQRNAGLRLDHLLLSPVIASRLRDAGVDREVRGESGASDHAPAWIVIEGVPARRGAARARSGKSSRKKRAASGQS